jgi:uncharacterized protein (DUF1810 family)
MPPEAGATCTSGEIGTTAPWLAPMTAVASGLGRYVEAQDDNAAYERAVAELRRGHKTGHWMWFVFPQLAGLGRSEMSRRFAITSVDEARAYLRHEVLGPRLLEVSGIVADAPATNAEAIFGTVDAKKLHSCMTLFMRADPAAAVFRAVLDRHYGGRPDTVTDRLLAPVVGDAADHA